MEPLNPRPKSLKAEAFISLFLLVTKYQQRGVTRDSVEVGIHTNHYSGNKHFHSL
jgi:hypothetical protein